MGRHWVCRGEIDTARRKAPGPALWRTCLWRGNLGRLPPLTSSGGCFSRPGAPAAGDSDWCPNRPRVQSPAGPGRARCETPPACCPPCTQPAIPLAGCALSWRRSTEQGWQGRGVARVAGRQNAAIPAGSRAAKKMTGSLFEAGNRHSHHNIKLKPSPSR